MKVRPIARNMIFSRLQHEAPRTCIVPLPNETGFTAIGRMIGKSKSACISRFHKIAAAMGQQAR